MWKSMDMDQKYEFFAPIWRVMRNENLTAEQVREQVEHVALVVKNGTQVRDIMLITLCMVKNGTQVCGITRYVALQ